MKTSTGSELSFWCAVLSYCLMIFSIVIGSWPLVIFNLVAGLLNHYNYVQFKKLLEKEEEKS